MRLPILMLAPVAALVLSACAGSPVGNPQVPEPARVVELPRYLGLWHEFARYENRFEKDCEGVTARYALRDDGDVSVTNTCRKGAIDGPLKVAQGKGVPAGDPKGAKLKVTFFGPALSANYWVLDHGPDYEWSIVGEGSGKFLWVLTREARPTAARRAELIDRVKALGYDVSLLRETKQPAS